MDDLLAVTVEIGTVTDKRDVTDRLLSLRIRQDWEWGYSLRGHRILREYDGRVECRIAMLPDEPIPLLYEKLLFLYVTRPHMRPLVAGIEGLGVNHTMIHEIEVTTRRVLDMVAIEIDPTDARWVARGA